MENPTLVRQKLLSITQKIRLPTICVLCKQFHTDSLAVCTKCIALLPTLGSACQFCAYPLTDDGVLICGQCIKEQPHVDKTLIAYRFEEPLRGLLHQFKYHNALYLKSFFSQLMLSAIQENSLPQCFIPVPMHTKRLKQRGFNQAALLAKKLSQIFKIPYDLHSCQKILHTEPQAPLKGKQRHNNLRKVFKAKPLNYQHVMIIDDLFTTGSTVNELAAELKKIGVQRVDVCCCARTVLKTGFHPERSAKLSTQK